MTGNASTRAVGMSAANEPKTSTPMGGASVSEVLAAAADLLEKPGAWTQGAWINGDCMCAEAAIGMAAGITYFPNVSVCEPALAFAGFVGDFIPVWNDAPGRTQAEVVDALRQAARQASNPTAEGV